MSCSRGGRGTLEIVSFVSRGPGLKSVPKTKVMLKNGKKARKISPARTLARTDVIKYLL